MVDAAPKLPIDDRPPIRLVYVKPPEPEWRYYLDYHWEPIEPRKRPTVRRYGNVAYVGWKPFGYRLIESDEGILVAWWSPTRHHRNRAIKIDLCPDWTLARMLLADIVKDHARPIWPDLRRSKP